MVNPLFSILIPVYNVEKYLPACLESVLAQDFDDYEIILVDDGSKDASGHICDDYCASYPDKIRVQHKPNQGLISARRVGLKLAVGEYICFLDSDDCLAVGMLGRLYETIQSTHSDVVLFRWRCIDENGAPTGNTIPVAFPQSGPVEKKAIFERMLSTNLLNSLCTKCCRRELFNVDTDYSAFFWLQNGEDLLQSFPVLYQSNTFYYLNEVLYQYRLNPASITHTFRKEQFRAVNVVSEVQYEYIIKLGLDTPKNRAVFLQSYLVSVWRNIEAMYRDRGTKPERNAVLDELRSFELVKQARSYLDSCGLPAQERLGIAIFYQNDNRKMNAYMAVYPMLRKVQRGFARIIAMVFQKRNEKCIER